MRRLGRAGNDGEYLRRTRTYLPRGLRPRNQPATHDSSCWRSEACSAIEPVAPISDGTNTETYPTAPLPTQRNQRGTLVSKKRVQGTLRVYSRVTSIVLCDGAAAAGHWTLRLQGRAPRIRGSGPCTLNALLGMLATAELEKAATQPPHSRV